MQIHDLINRAEKDCQPLFSALEETEMRNTRRVLDAFHEEDIAVRHFAPTTGYGYDDIGRDKLEAVFARLFGAECAIVRPGIACGTAALSLCLFGLLLPGDHLLSATGAPYDTMETVIGLSGHAPGNLKEMGVSYSQVDMADDQTRIDVQGVLDAITPHTKVILIQRSRGYAWRSSLRPEEMAPLISAVRSVRPDIFIMVDNCYGEFICETEPTHFGADVCVGSLIKNPGGGMAPTGAYLAGTKRAIERIEARLTAPGLGREVGSYAASYQPFYQGLFLAPHTVTQALTFVQGIQAASPIDGSAVPEPWDMPGYADQVIMAAGTFVSGASIELSADAPMRAPYTVYLQGGLTYAHGKLALQCALEKMQKKGSLSLS